MNDHYIYHKKDVKEKLLFIKSIFERNENITIVISDLVKAIEYGYVEGIEKDTNLGYLTYLYEDDEIYAFMEVDVNGCDQYFIKDFNYKDTDCKLDFYNLKFNKNNICYI